ncbi:MAG: Ig-like domain-containing protein [Deltaproteobacteria bacterium]|nr:Ig-like domain-containing protein [Deltaproteobacteria bacterium]
MLRSVLALAAAAALAAGACRSGPPGAERLERITIGPREARRPVGEAQRFTATGHYGGGATRNLTQRVRWESSDPRVAAAVNAKGDRSRIEALAPGTAVITATDPRTGVSSHASGGATITVLGALERITLAPAALGRRVGQTQRLTATGHYAGGATRNLTQRVVYRSSDPAVAAAPNDDGDRSRVEIVGVGAATISAIDAETGVSSTTTGGDATIVAVAAKPSPARE